MGARRVLVTGGGGFVGAVLVRRLLAAGHEVHVPLKPGTSRWRLEEVWPDLRAHECDLRDEERVRGLVSDVQPDLVYHMAAHGAYPHQTNADDVIRTNILGTWNLLRSVARHGCEVFVNAGSSSEYGSKPFAMRETDLLEPNSYYAVAKSAQSLLCQHFARIENLPLTTFRLFSVYGPFEEPTRFVPTIIRNCLEGRDLALVSPDTARDFVYVEDVVDACLLLEPLSKRRGEVINLGTGIQSTIRDVVSLVLQETGARVEARYGTMEPRIWDSSTWVADCTQARRLLGWRATTALPEGLRRTIEWTRRRASA